MYIIFEYIILYLIIFSTNDDGTNTLHDPYQHDIEKLEDTKDSIDAIYRTLFVSSIIGQQLETVIDGDRKLDDLSFDSEYDIAIVVSDSEPIDPTSFGTNTNMFQAALDAND